MLLPKLNKIDYLLVFVPITLALEFLNLTHDPLVLFICAILGILPLASKMGEATEELAKYFGPHLGGLLNATFGNMAELIIALLAIQRGLFDLVKASITGSIIGNLLFVLGLSIILGGTKYKEQKMSSNVAGMNSTMLLIAVLSIMIPSIFHLFPENHNLSSETNLSLIIAVLLIILYALSMFFSLKTHSHLFASHEKEQKPHMSKRDAAILLGIATVFLAILAEVLVGQVEAVGHTVGLSEIFIGAVVVAVVGNAAEHLAAIMFALKNDLDVAVGITIGSSLQIALFVAPVVVIAGELIGKPMDLVFTPFEVIALVASVLVVNEITTDAKVNWFEGVQLITLYVIIAALFFFIR